MTEVLAFPTSFAQQRLWFVNELEPPGPAYNISAAVRMSGPLNAPALIQALMEVARRQDSLRTTFLQLDGHPVQAVHPAAERSFLRSLSTVDMSALPAGHRESAARTLLDKQAGIVFDLQHGPLFRIAIVRLSEHEHLTAIVMHHIISDGWSMSVLISEMEQFYRHCSRGLQSSLSELPIQYRDYSVWQRQWLKGDMLEKEVAYWRTQLSGLEPLDLATRWSGHRHQDQGGEMESLHLSPALTFSLKQAARRDGATMFMMMLAALKVILSRYAGQTDVAVGTPIANRTHAQLEGVIGFFMNTLVLRSRIDPDMVMRNLIQQEKAIALDAYAHQNLPFEKLVEELHPERNLSRNPLFDVMFNFVNTPAQRLDLPRLSLSSILVNEAESKLPLTVYAQETGDAITVTARYRPSFFSRDSIAVLLNQLRFLLEQVAADPSKPAGAYTLVTPDVAAVLPDPGQKLEEPNQEPITVTFARIAAERPHQPAISASNQSLSYEELFRRSRKLGMQLVAGGIQRGDVVAVFGPRSRGLITAMMATLQSGGVLLTLDPALPTRRLRQMISIARAKRVLHVGDRRPPDDWLIGEGGPAATFIDAETGIAIEREGPVEPALPTVSPDDRCYIFFTSGTTGEPRAVLGLHKGLSHFLSWQRTRFGVGPEDRSAQLTALSFDVVLRDVFLPLTSGAILCLPDEHDLSTPDRTVLWLERERITTLHAVPALAETWLAEAPPGIFLRHLRLVFFAGEPLRDSLVRRWRQSFPESGEMVNLYGPTETTLAKCFHVVPADESPGIQPVGRPLPQTQALVLNGSRALCGAGELGEIVIRTPFRTLGYLNDPASNEARFAINPFTGDPNDRLYFTGDRGRYRADGSVAILGRLDNQVKIRGVRVELEEIEALLSHSPLIASCVVTAELDGNGNLSLVAYVVPSGHVDNELAVDLRRFATTFFPAAMVPSAFVFVDRVPLTPNGKADRVALASQRGPIGSADLETAAPRTPVEEVLASIWQDLLARTRLSIYDNFFELGGHSLLATQVASRINKAFGISIPLRAFFEHPTIAGLAAEVEAFAQAPEKLPIPPIERAADRSVFPLSFAQRRLWILHRLHPESTAYNIPFVVRIRGPLDTAAFDAALASLVRRHEILRTIFPIEDGSPIQVVLGTPDTVLAIIDLRKVPAEEREAELEYVTLTEARRPFSLTREPGLRASLVQLSPGDHLLLMTMHHIINDGWSRTTLADEVMLSYGAMRSGAAPLPQPPIQYGDFAAWQRGMLEYELIELLGYWGRELEGAPSELVLPFDRARSAEAEHTGAIASIVIGPDLSDLVVKLSRRTGTSLFMTMLAALKILLYKWTGQSDIVLGTVIANRNRLDTERLLGCFVNFLPLRSRLSEPDTGFNLLDRIRTTVLEAYKHQDCPFDLIVDEVKPERKQNANPIYNVVFQLQNLPQARLAEMHNLELQHKPIELGTSLLDLRFVARETAEGIHLLCEYDTGVFVQDTIDSLLSCYTETLRKIAMEPGARLREHPLSERLEEQVTRSGQSQPFTIAIASTFSAQPIEDSLRFWIGKLAFDAEIVFAPFNQVFQQLLDPGSLFLRNRNGVNVILLRIEDWRARESALSGPQSLGDIESTVEANASYLDQALKSFAARSSVPCVVCLCPASPSMLASEADARRISRIEESLKDGLEGAPDVHIITSRDLSSKYPVAEYYDRRGYELGAIPYTSHFFTALGTMIARTLSALRGPSYKVIALDCDHTLWNGICGEDGAEAVTIEPAHRFLQEFMVAQHDAGMLLCLCSKNNEADVVEVFERNPEMIVRLDHIVSRRINWAPKADNLKAMADELHLGLDSFIFIDDDPVECAAMRATTPEVLTLQLPERRDLIPRFLNNVWAFDRVRLTEEDRQRTGLYRRARRREQSEREAPSIEQFLAGLDLRVEIAKLEPADIDRVSQLTYRTNQFNLTSRRRTARDIQLLHGSGSLECYVVRMSDRFGEYGLVGVMIFHAAGESLNVDTFLLSCRALGKNAEKRMVEWLGEYAARRGLGEVVLPFVHGPRNQPALEFLEGIGRPFKQVAGEGLVFRLPARYAAGLENQSAVLSTSGVSI